MNTFRVLAIVPYPGLKNLMDNIVREFPQIELTTLVGYDLDGVKIAQEYFHEDYDIVISRLNTAKMIQSLQLPVVEIEISKYDILCALQSVSASCQKIAVVLSDPAQHLAKEIQEAFDYDFDVFLYPPAGDIRQILQKCLDEHYDAVLCGMHTHTVATQMGLNAFLLTSDAESVRHAFREAILVCSSQAGIRKENRFFRKLLGCQDNKVLVFSRDGEIILSNYLNIPSALLEYLQTELFQGKLAPERSLHKMLAGRMYYMKYTEIREDDRDCAVVSIRSRRVPTSYAMRGLFIYSFAEVEVRREKELFNSAEFIDGLSEQIADINLRHRPAVLYGQPGVGKTALAHEIFLRGPFRSNSFYIIDCDLATEETWTFLFDNYDSPLLSKENVLFFSNIDSLSPMMQKQLASFLRESESYNRNQVLFSGFSEGNSNRLSPACIYFSEYFFCQTVYLPPFKALTGKIPRILALVVNRAKINNDNRVIGFSPGAVSALQAYAWPRNKAQFSRVVHELVTVSSSTVVTEDDVKSILCREQTSYTFSARSEEFNRPLDLSRTLDEIIKDIVRKVWEDNGNNQTAAAKSLGISRTTIWRILNS